MSKLFLEILDPKRHKVFELLSSFPNFLLAGGTGLALQIGHRISYDFDLLSDSLIPESLLDLAVGIFSEYKITPIVNTTNELSLILDNEIKLSFIHFPFKPLHEPIEIKNVNVYSIRDISSNKVYVIGRRGEWKDYVDLYFLVRYGKLKIEKIIGETKLRFKNNFNEKLFWEQLVYYEDISNFNIEYVSKDKPNVEEIQNFFKELTTRKIRL